MSPLKINWTTRPALPVVAAAAVITALLACGAARAQSGPRPNSGCLTFESPLAGNVYSAPSCTVSLNVDCGNVSRVELQARYHPENSDSAVIVSLGSISRPPYKLIWNTSNLPNQLFTGIGILAEAMLPNGTTHIARQEGIFLTHNPVRRTASPIPYSPSASSVNTEAFARKFDMGDPQKSATSVIAWNEKELTVHVAVKDPSFYSNQPGRNIADAGLEILIDPARRRSPHPGNGTLFFVVPLSGSPYKINYSAEINGGAFRLVPQTSSTGCQYNVGRSEFKGYTIGLSIPKEAFGRAIPDTIACNMVLRVLDNQGQVQKISLSGGNVFEMYSPFCWPDYYRLNKPLLMNAGLQWFIFSAAGFLLALGIYLLISKLRKPHLLSSFERSEEEKVVFERVNSVIEQELIRKDLKIDYVAGKCDMEPQALNGLIKRCTGFSFINYLQFCRTEVAKERLRSSRSSEKSIADLCGFTSAMEMEKCFAKFHHTTPYKFRAQHQVA